MLKRVLSFFMAGLVSMSLMTGCGSKQKVEEEIKEPSSEYVEVLNKYGLEDVNYTFQGKKSIVFASEVSADTLEILAFGYTNDIAEEMYDKVYLDISSYIDEEDMVNQIDESIRNEFDKVSKLDFATIEYTVDKELGMYIIEIYYDDLSKENVEELISSGLISGSDGMNQISIEQTTESAKSNGLIQR